MGLLLPYDQQNPEQWKQQNDEVLKTVHDDSLRAIIIGILNMHELEHNGKWRNSGRRLDYANSKFEVYLHHHTTWSLNDFRLLEEVIFEHFAELKRNGLGTVLTRLKKLKNEPNPLKKRRMRKIK